MTDFYINTIPEAGYPDSQYNFHPDQLYPEYPWGESEISPDRNIVYDMVRNCLIGLRMDENNIGTKDWNPFRELIKEGDIVLVKPNWVMHFNKNKAVTENSLECMITHPSITRVIIDYCILALKGTGKLIVGDSPMQGCDLDKLLMISDYNRLFSFYNAHSIDIEPVDFRQYSTIVDKHKILKGRKYNSGEGIEVFLDGSSRFISAGAKARKFRVSDYNEKTTNLYHNHSKHSYLINKDVLSADVVMNLCKPKCHRLAGMTGAIKNFVGITYDKACLPHRTVGSSQEGGDEYLHKSMIKRLIARVLNRKIYFEEHNLFLLSLIMRYIYGSLYYLIKFTGNDTYLMGSWHGNDTIWRTVLDLYQILLYADKNGVMKEERQRKIFSIADMIISGERNGPVAPEPKKLGIILAGFEAVMMDRLLCDIMGFDPMKVPGVKHAVSDKRLLPKDVNNYSFASNLREFNKKNINDLLFPKQWRFKPYDSWKGFVEK